MSAMGAALPLMVWVSPEVRARSPSAVSLKRHSNQSPLHRCEIVQAQSRNPTNVRLDVLTAVRTACGAFDALCSGTACFSAQSLLKPVPGSTLETVGRFCAVMGERPSTATSRIESEAHMTVKTLHPHKLLPRTFLVAVPCHIGQNTNVKGPSWMCRHSFRQGLYGQGLPSQATKITAIHRNSRYSKKQSWYPECGESG